jgi:hypothetical protein
MLRIRSIHHAGLMKGSDRLDGRWCSLLQMSMGIAVIEWMHRLAETCRGDDGGVQLWTGCWSARMVCLWGRDRFDCFVDDAIVAVGHGFLVVSL